MHGRAPAQPILVVEDDDDNREMLAAMLTMDGYITVAVPNGAEALKAARDYHPWLILLDMMMPVMSGVDFRTAQLADRELARIPVVLLTARHDAELMAQRLTAAAFLTKPFDAGVLLSKVSALCERQA